MIRFLFTQRKITSHVRTLTSLIGQMCPRREKECKHREKFLKEVHWSTCPSLTSIHSPAKFAHLHSFGTGPSPLKGLGVVVLVHLSGIAVLTPAQINRTKPGNKPEFDLSRLKKCVHENTLTFDPLKHLTDHKSFSVHSPLHIGLYSVSVAAHKPSC